MLVPQICDGELHAQDKVEGKQVHGRSREVEGRECRYTGRHASHFTSFIMGRRSDECNIECTVMFALIQCSNRHMS